MKELQFDGWKCTVEVLPSNDRQHLTFTGKGSVSSEDFAKIMRECPHEITNIHLKNTHFKQFVADYKTPYGYEFTLEDSTIGNMIVILESEEGDTSVHGSIFYLKKSSIKAIVCNTPSIACLINSKVPYSKNFIVSAYWNKSLFQSALDLTTQVVCAADITVNEDLVELGSGYTIYPLCFFEDGIWQYFTNKDCEQEDLLSYLGRYVGPTIFRSKYKKAQTNPIYVQSAIAVLRYFRVTR